MEKKKKNPKNLMFEITYPVRLNGEQLAMFNEIAKKHPAYEKSKGDSLTDLENSVWQSIFIFGLNNAFIQVENESEFKLADFKDSQFNKA